MSNYSDKELRDMYKEAFAMSTISKIKHLPDGYITDENKSVKWNREQVELSKTVYKEDVERLKNLKLMAIQKAKQAYVDNIIEFMQIGNCKPLSREGAEKLLEKVIEYSDNDPYQFDSYISDFYDIRNLE